MIWGGKNPYFWKHPDSAEMTDGPVLINFTAHWSGRNPWTLTQDLEKKSAQNGEVVEVTSDTQLQMLLKMTIWKPEK